MARKIRAYVSTDMVGSDVEADYELPENWDSMSAKEQEAELEQIAMEHRGNHSDFGAFLVDDE